VSTSRQGAIVKYFRIVPAGITVTDALPGTDGQPAKSVSTTASSRTPGEPDVKVIWLVPWPESIVPPEIVQANVDPATLGTLATRPETAEATVPGAETTGAVSGRQPYAENPYCVPTYTFPFTTVGTANLTAGPGWSRAPA